jgi:hypothetical protein
MLQRYPFLVTASPDLEVWVQSFGHLAQTLHYSRTGSDVGNREGSSWTDVHPIYEMEIIAGIIQQNSLSH